MNNRQWNKLGKRIAMIVGGFVLLVCFAQCGSTSTAATSQPTPVAQPPRTVYVTVPAAPTTTTTTPPAAAEEPAAAPDVDIHSGDHVNLPDGALTGGYCRHKWWC